MTPEAKVKAKVKRALANYPDAYTYMPVPGGFGAVSLDFLICFRGQFIAVETKAPGKKPTKLQEVTMAAMRRAGAKVFVIDGSADTMAPLLQLFEDLEYAHEAFGLGAT